MVPMCFASQRTNMGPTWNPCLFAICTDHVGPMCDYHYGATYGMLLRGHTGVCNNFPRGTHVFCLSKNPHGTHMKPVCVCHLYYPCWVNMWLSLWGHTWAAANGAHGSMQQFPMYFASQSTHTGPTYNPCVFTICVAHVRPMCAYFLWGQCELLLEAPCALPLKTPTLQMAKMAIPAGVQW